MIFPQTYENQGVEGCGVNENWPHKKICFEFWSPDGRTP